ncbi:MFS transporter [Candidatus Njordibacter sp. Uisw_039]|uniref:MFS transporter n=1 Tax=Candidatus Njordibacter sp. Uisw_039 TaxID=3230972 RepID=UPI003D4B218A
MLQEIKASWALLLGIGFIMLGNGLQGTLLGVRASLEGFDVFTTGVVMSFYFSGMLVGSILTPKLVSRVGHIRVFAALASTASIAILLHSIYINPYTWSLMRFVTGICFSGLFVVSESWLNDRASNENRGAILSVYMVVITLGMGSGQFLLNVADPASTELFILISVIISFALVPILLTARPAPAFDQGVSMSIFALYKVSPLAVISNALTGAAHGTAFSLGAVYGLQKGFDNSLLALFMASFLWGGFLLQWPIGRLSDKYGRRGVMLITSLVAVILCSLASAWDTTSSSYIPLIVVLGGSVMPMYSLCIAYASDRLSPEQIVSASGAMFMAGGIGLSIGPILVAFAMSSFGPDVYFIGIAIAFVAISLAVLNSMRYREVTPEDVEEQSPMLAAGVIGTPIAAFAAPDAQDYAVALEEDELEQLDDSDEWSQAPMAGPETAIPDTDEASEEDHY